MKKEDLERVTNENQHAQLKTGQKRQLSRRWWLVAICTTLLLGMVIWIQLQPEPAHLKLYGQYFEPYPNSLHTISREDENLSLETQAFIFYENGNFGAALAIFQSISAQNPQPDYQFYEAVTLMTVGHNRSAAKLLDQLKYSNTQYLPQVFWYRTLCALRLKDLTQAKTDLQILLEQHGPYQQAAAQQILKHLEQ